MTRETSLDTAGADAPAPAAAPAPQAAAPKPPAPRPAWVTRFQASLGHWIVSFAALAAGIAFWHYACANNLTLYIRFENVPGPLPVFNSLLTHLAEKWDPLESTCRHASLSIL